MDSTRSMDISAQSWQLMALFYSYRITNSSGSLGFIQNLPFISLRYLDCGYCLGPWNICEFLYPNNLFVWAGILVNQVIFFYWYRQWSSQPKEELEGVCVRFNTLQRVLFTCYACTAFSEWLTHLCCRLQPPLPSSNFPKALSNYIPLAGAGAGMSLLFPAALYEWQPCSVYITVLMVWLQRQAGCGIFSLKIPHTASSLSPGHGAAALHGTASPGTALEAVCSHPGARAGMDAKPLCLAEERLPGNPRTGGVRQVGRELQSCRA